MIAMYKKEAEEMEVVALLLAPAPAATGQRAVTLYEFKLISNPAENIKMPWLGFR